MRQLLTGGHGMKWYTLSLIPIFAAFQNFTIIEKSGSPSEFNASLSAPVIEKTRKAHAKELLGQQYLSSWASQGGQIKDLSSHIYNEVERLLPKKYKKSAGEITRSLILESQKNGFDPLFIVALIKTESSFNPLARGRHGEIGLMQIKPTTAAWISKRFGLKWFGPSTLENPNQNMKIGISYLSYLRKKFKNNPELYIAAYNAGSTKTRRLAALDKTPQVYRAKILSKYIVSYKKIVKNSSTLFAAN